MTKKPPDEEIVEIDAMDESDWEKDAHTSVQELDQLSKLVQASAEASPSEASRARTANTVASKPAIPPKPPATPKPARGIQPHGQGVEAWAVARGQEGRPVRGRRCGSDGGTGDLACVRRSDGHLRPAAEAVVRRRRRPDNRWDGLGVVVPQVAR